MWMLTFAFFCNFAVTTAFTGTVVVQGSHHLRVHTTSFATSPVVEELNNGVTVSISCKKAGTHESGSQGSTDQWYLVDSKGYASAAYIHTGKVLIPACGPAPPVPPPSKDCHGPDVSHYQGSIDWTKVHASGVGFAIAKATEGETNVDDHFHTNWNGIKAAGIPVRGAYHFGHPGESASTQANHFVSHVGALSAGDFLVLDIEKATSSLRRETNITAITNNTVITNITSTRAPRRRQRNDTAMSLHPSSPAAVAAWCKEFVDAVGAATGLPKSRVWVYTGAWFWDPSAGGSAAVGDHPLWVSGYATAPPMPKGWASYTMWQYTDKKVVPGVANPCDYSRFHGTQAQLEHLVGL